VSTETRDQASVVLVQSSRGPELVQPLLRALDGISVGKVLSREPTLEDAYVELVREA
jgi:ABC-2 type transport system ATP-binding protein